MEYVDGHTLRGIDTKKTGTEVLLKYATQIAEALQEAHVSGVVHRDIKAENIMVNTKSQVKIMDFGLAKLKGSLKLTKTSSTVGTLAYMAPEQIRGEEVDGRSDIFSFGVLLHEMLSGSMPFRGEHEAAIMYSILNEEPKKLAGSGIMERIGPMVLRMLEKNPKDRYQSMKEVLTDLRSFSGVPTTDSTEESSAASIAVLPFADLSPAKDQEYFCDGIAEEIINALTKQTDLLVVARTSAFAFKGKNQDVREIGSKLNVSTVLEGSLRKSGKRLRITAQLINVADGYHVWSERYDREEEDVFAIQDEIALSIVRALKVKLTGTQETSLARTHKESIDAYNLYLQGRYFWGKRTTEGLRKSIDYFRQAIDAEPGYALAYAALADSYCLLCSYHVLSPDESIAQAKAAALKAVELDPSLSEAHEALGHVLLLYDWDWNRARQEYAEAIRLHPFFSTAHQRMALLMSVTGELEGAVDEIRKAEKLDPLSQIILTDAALMFYLRGQNEEAVRACGKVLAMNPEFHVANLVLGMTYEQIGTYDRAVDHLEKAVESSGKSSIMRSSLAHCLAVMGRNDEASEILGQLMKEQNHTYVSPYSIAVIHLGMGQTEVAFDWFRKAVEEHSVWHIHLHLSVDPRFLSIRSTPQFVSLLAQLKLGT